jgi:predicted nucleic acid-binding Zn ribbon protein
MESINGFYPEMYALIPSHEWECRKCGALLELPADGQPVTICEECQQEERDDDASV